MQRRAGSPSRQTQLRAGAPPQEEDSMLPSLQDLPGLLPGIFHRGDGAAGELPGNIFSHSADRVVCWARQTIRLTRLLGDEL